MQYILSTVSPELQACLVGALLADEISIWTRSTTELIVLFVCVRWHNSQRSKCALDVPVPVTSRQLPLADGSTVDLHTNVDQTRYLKTPSSSKVIRRNQNMKKGGVGSCTPNLYMVMVPQNSKKSCTVLSDQSQARSALGCVLCTAMATTDIKNARRQLRPSTCCRWNANRRPVSKGGIANQFELDHPIRLER